MPLMDYFTHFNLDLQISRAVEMEVARRLEERERQQKEKEEEERRSGEHNENGEPASERPTSKEHTLPSGLLTPLLKRHKDLGDELQLRLQELENK